MQAWLKSTGCLLMKCSHLDSCNDRRAVTAVATCLQSCRSQRVTCLEALFYIMKTNNHRCGLISEKNRGPRFTGDILKSLTSQSFLVIVNTDSSSCWRKSPSLPPGCTHLDYFKNSNREQMLEFKTSGAWRETDVRFSLFIFFSCSNKLIDGH